MKINNYPQEELDRIQLQTETNDKLESFLEREREEYTEKCKAFFATLKKENFCRDKIELIFDSQSEALSLRSDMNYKINTYLNRLSSNNTKTKVIYQEKLLFYSGGAQYKPGAGEKKVLIDAHLAQNERNTELYESHIDFLRNQAKVLESFSFSVKNNTELLKYLGET